MNQPHLYSESNDMPVADAIYVLNKYFHFIRWKTDGGDNILDIGCGDGRVTSELLYPRLPEKIGKLVATDISPEMIEFAKVHHSKEKLSYIQFDICTKDLDKDLEEKFDHIFSFYCLHLIQDIRHCAFNLYNILNQDGDIFLMFLGKNTIYQIYQNLSKHKIWAKYMKDIKKQNIYQYYYSEDPAKEYENVLTQVGFDVHFCMAIDRSYTFKDIFSWKKFAMAVTPFYFGQIPDDLEEKYIDDFLNETRKLNYTVLNEKNNEETVQMQHKIFVVYASKSV